MTEFLQSLYLTFKAAIFDWYPKLLEMKKAAWGPYGDIAEFIGKIATIIAVGAVIKKFLDDHGIDTW